MVTRQQFKADLLNNYAELTAYSIEKKNAPFFLPPYEWYNDTIAKWANEMELQLINFTPGTLSNADYTTPGMKNYRSSETIYSSIIDAEQSKPAGLNGFLLLLHVGTDPKRTDKFYNRLPGLIKYLGAKGYHFQTVDELLANQ